MIDHLELESEIVEVESKEGKAQIKKFGIPEPWSGKNEIIYVNISRTKIHILESDEDKENRLELIARYADEQKEEEPEKHTNQFSFIERATQTKNNTHDTTESQTDPPPM